MHKKIMFFSVSAFLLIGCATQYGFTEEPVRDHSKRYVIDRFSFLPPIGQGWQAIIHDDKESVAFNFYHDNQGYNGKIIVGSVPDYVGLAAQDIAEDIQYDYDQRDEKYLRHLDEYDKNVDDVRDAYIERVNSVPKPTTQVVKIAGLTCAKSIDYIRELTPVAEYRTPTDGGVSRWIRYFCPVPSQPDQGPIVVNFYLTAAPGKPMLDMEAILKPLLDSIEIIENPLTASSRK